MYLGLHPKQHGHLIVEDSVPSLHAGETPPGVLHSVLGPQQGNDLGLLKKVQRRGKKSHQTMGHFCEERLGDLGLFSMEVKLHIQFKKRRLLEKDDVCHQFSDVVYIHQIRCNLMRASAGFCT